MIRTEIELNALEKSFFRNFIPVELDVPVHASLTYRDETLEVIVLPRINQHGHFVMDYSNASPFVPEPVGGVFTFNGSSMSDIHPLLERAWLSGEPVKVELRISPQGFPPVPFENNVSVEAKVIYANQGHRGRIALWNNQVTADVQPIQEARFSLSGFPDFIVSNSLDDVAGIRSIRESVNHLMPKGWTVNPPPRETSIVLRTETGWEINLSKGINSTREKVIHEGSITRSNGEEFELKDLDHLLIGLATYLAFVKGDYCTPTTVLAYHHNGKPLWGRIGQFNDASKPLLNWFDRDELAGAYLETLFPKFWQRWTNRPREIQTVVDLHIRSLSTRQNGNPLAALVESFASLEGLASLTVGKTISNNAAAAAIDQELKGLKVPNRTLPSINNTQITAIASRLGVKENEGIHLLNKVRNYFPHPLLRDTTAEIKIDLNELVQEDPWSIVYLHDLSQFYFEHLFLAYCGPEFHPQELGKERYRRLLAENNTVQD